MTTMMRKTLKAATAPDQSALRRLEIEIVSAREQHARAERQLEQMRGQLGSESDEGAARQRISQIAEVESLIKWLEQRLAVLEADRGRASAQDAIPVVAEKIRCSNDSARQALEAAEAVETAITLIERELKSFLLIEDRINAMRNSAAGLIERHALDVPDHNAFEGAGAIDPKWRDRLRAVAEQIDERIRGGTFGGFAWIAKLNALRLTQQKGKR